jgi:hypothetical protein
MALPPPTTAEQRSGLEVLIMGKVLIVKAFLGSLLGFATAVVIFALAAGLALANDSSS